MKQKDIFPLVTKYFVLLTLSFSISNLLFKNVGGGREVLYIDLKTSSFFYPKGDSYFVGQ